MIDYPLGLFQGSEARLPAYTKLAALGVAAAITLLLPGCGRNPITSFCAELQKPNPPIAQLQSDANAIGRPQLGTVAGAAYSVVIYLSDKVHWEDLRSHYGGISDWPTDRQFVAIYCQ